MASPGIYAAPYYPVRQDPDRTLLYAILISVLIHTLFVLLIKPHPSAVVEPERFIEISLRPPPPIEKLIKKPEEIPPIKEQIVSPSESPETKEVPQTNLKSDKNTVVEKEQIKRGEGPTKSTPSVDKLVKLQPKTETKDRAQEKRSSDNKTELKTDNLQLKLSDSALTDLALTPKEAKGSMRSLSKYQPFSKSEDSNDEIFRMNPGSPDFLPKLPDGDITLLNAKADRFAPFVRRVAMQVFGMVRKLQWHTIPASEIRKIEDFVTIEAIMSPKGTLLGVKMLEASGSPAFDRMLNQSVQGGVNDQNPPPGATAPDGNIHFIFRSRCWTRPGGGPVSDARWLLLATGLL